MKNHRAVLIPFLMLSFLALLLGLWAGLARIGWAIPVFPDWLPIQHGPLMISGFLGTLIALERVAALRQPWMFAAPLLSGTGWLLGLALPASWIGPGLISLGSLFTTAVLVAIVRREPRVYTLTMLVGVSCWLGGNLYWMTGAPIFQLVWLWAAFLILTIAGERLELSRVLRIKPWHQLLFALAAAVLLLGAVLNTQFPAFGARIAGVGMLALAAWLLRFDIARRNLRHPAPLTRFIAACLFGGYLWLGVSALLNLIYGPQVAGLRYDANLHSLFIGFVFAMIFGHALIILPALTPFNVPFRPLFYLPLILLHGSLAIRIASALSGWSAGRMWGGLLNEVAILGYIGTLIFALVQQKVAGSEPGKKPAYRTKNDPEQV